MARARSLWRRSFVGAAARLGHEEKVLRYTIHRIDQDADPHGVLREPCVLRDCSRAEIEEIASSADPVHAAREHPEGASRSGEPDPKRRLAGRA